jgi:hypothetical protein
LKQEDVIHATIWKSLIDTYRPHIKESCFLFNHKLQGSASNYISSYKQWYENSICLQNKYEGVEGILTIHPKYYFDFATRENLLERENKETQCLGNLSHIYLFIY